MGESDDSLIRHLKSHAVAYVALFVALGGTAVALPGANTVNSGDIINGQVKPQDAGVSPAAVRYGSTTSIANGSIEAFAWPASFTYPEMPVNQGGVFDTAKPTRLKATRDGLWETAGNMVWPSNATGHRFIGIKQHFTPSGFNEVFVAGNEVDASSGGVEYTQQSVSAVIQMEKGDYVELYGYQTSGAGMTPASGEGTRTNFSLTWLGPAS